jgi:hypothetical protein
MSNRAYNNRSNRKPKAPPMDAKAIKESTARSQKDFAKMCSIFWDSNPFHVDLKTNTELEMKFGSRGKYNNPTRNDYDNVIKQILSMGFTSVNTSGEYLLRIFNEFLDSSQSSSTYTASNIRTDITGLPAIQQYCKTNDIVQILDNPAYSGHVVMQKKGKFKHEGRNLPAVSFHDFNFRTTLNEEETYNTVNRFGLVKSIIDRWSESKKTFRYMNRVTFTHPDYPVNIDISIVKSSNVNGQGDMESAYNTSDSGVFNAMEVYEMEIEVDNTRIGPGTNCATVNVLVEKMKKCAKFIMMGLQETNYPISASEKRQVTFEYLQLIKEPPSEHLRTKNFIGPSSYTLQTDNLVDDKNEELKKPNVRKNYTVTDKADGERRIMYISAQGMVYLINTNAKILFTGARTTNESCFNTIMDGEIIMHDKTGRYINLFAAFDIYITNKVNIRANKFFVPVEEEKTKSRLHELSRIMTSLNLQSVSGVDTPPPIRVTVKQFYASSDSTSIFAGCSSILKRMNDSLFEYNTDGLIFTPSLLGVGSNTIGSAGPMKKRAWSHSFKWKPAHFNTVDFMVNVQKGTDGNDVSNTIFSSGVNVATAIQYKQYKTIVLHCGYDESEYGYLNPCNDVMNGTYLPESKTDSKTSDDGIPNSNRPGEQKSNYRPVQFFPSNPYDEMGGICNIMLRKDSNGVEQMYTEENEVVENNTIVEFRYDLDKESGWRWIPLRVRYDKTAELRRSFNNFGNDYLVANSNWYSIHNPITDDMLSTGRNISITSQDDVYYNSQSSSKHTVGMCNFHNRYVKQRLIQNVSKRGDTLIDFACGKAGDLPKWIDAKLSFVLGLDLSPDNLDNRQNGACVRYLNTHKEQKSVPGALFVQGDSGFNIRNGDAMKSDKSKQVVSAVFGNSAKDVNLGAGVAKYHGVGEDGFNISSCQFALHYFFKDKHVLHRFMANVSECTKVGGYFIGTCYDGKKMFNLLKSKEKGEEAVLYHNKKKKIWGVQKMYSEDNFYDDETSLGYTIKVYQETINKPFDEYLVNFTYMTQLMENYGFQVLSDQDAINLGFPAGTGLFEDLFNDMTKRIRANHLLRSAYGKAPAMTENDKEISFKNRYFIFKKTSNVNIDRVVSEQRSSDDIASALSASDTSLATSLATSPVTSPATSPPMNVESPVMSKAEPAKPAEPTKAKKSKKPKVPTVRKPRKLNKSIRLDSSA